MLRKVSYLAVMVFAVTVVSAQAIATLNWGSGTVGDLYSDGGFTTLLPGDETGAVSGLVQLWYLGVDGWGGAEDLVIDYVYVGESISPAKGSNDGRFIGSVTHSYTAGSNFGITFFEDHGAGGGAEPLTGDWGTVGELLTSTADPGANGVDNWEITTQSAATTPVPEPSVMALLGLGVACLILRKRKK